MAKKGFDIDFSSLDFDLGFGSGDIESEKEREFIRSAVLNRQPVDFEKAADMARKIDITQDYFCLVSGSFIFGDFIEALCYIHDLKPTAIYLTTLGMSMDNVDSIVNLVDYLGVEQFEFIHDPDIFNYIRTILDGTIADYTVIDGAAGTTIFTNNANNTGRFAWDHVRRGIERWQTEADGAAPRIKTKGRRTAAPKCDE